MTHQRRNILIVLGLAVLALIAWHLTRPKPDMTLIGTDIKGSRIVYDGTPTGAASVNVPFTRKSDEYDVANLAIDLNNDGKMEAYKAVGGVTQEEWVVKNGFAKAVEEGNAFSFDIVDADVSTRNNFRVVAVLTEDALVDWQGEIPGASAAAEAKISSFVPEDYAPLFTASADSAGAGGLIDAPLSAEPAVGAPTFLKASSIKIKTAGNAPWLSDTTAGAGAGAGEAAAIGAEPAADLPPAAGSDFEVFQPGMPDMTQGHNECVPTSISNGLSWLGDRYGFKDKLPPTQLAAREEIKGDLGWTSADGANMGNNVINAKVAFSRRHDLPIVTHQIGGNLDEAFVRKIAVELKKGQAVEVGVGYYTQDAAGTFTRHGGHMVSAVGAFGSNGKEYLGLHDPLSPEAGRLDIYPVDKNRMMDYRYRGNTMVFIEYAYAESPTAAWLADHPPQTALDVRGIVEGKNLQDVWFVDMLNIGTAWYPVKQFHTYTGPECDRAEHWHANIGTAWGIDLKDRGTYFEANPEKLHQRHAPAVEWKDPEGCGAGKSAVVKRFAVMLSKEEASDLLSKIIQ